MRERARGSSPSAGRSYFRSGRINEYTLTSLKDLAGVRVLAFPSSRLGQIDTALREVFETWAADRVLGEHGEMLALKYSGICALSERCHCEYQIVSMLTGLFGEVEHSAIYKPSPQLRGVARSLSMQARSRDVLAALSAFEEEFERLIRADTTLKPRS
jgi:hypothetical protein